jgi:pantothenate kinase
VTAVTAIETSLPALVERARALIPGPGEPRAILGLAGPPGAGKSTVTNALAAALGEAVAICGMDGFHLSNPELRRLGRLDRKGAIDTFDGHGYVALLRRLLADPPHVVYAPSYDRSIEEAVAIAVPVAPSARLVITEGNYLLVADEPWASVRSLLAEAWYVDLDDDTRNARLIPRHIAAGKAPGAARAFVLASDAANARVVAPTIGRADLVVRLG